VKGGGNGMIYFLNGKARCVITDNNLNQVAEELKKSETKNKSNSREKAA
jgi:hypothetical protein